MDIIKNETYHNFLNELKERIYRARYDTPKVVNKELINIETYIKNQKLAPLVQEIGRSHRIAVFFLTTAV